MLPTKQVNWEGALTLYEFKKLKSGQKLLLWNGYDHIVDKASIVEFVSQTDNQFTVKYKSSVASLTGKYFTLTFYKSDYGLTHYECGTWNDTNRIYLVDSSIPLGFKNKSACKIVDGKMTIPMYHNVTGQTGLILNNDRIYSFDEIKDTPGIYRCTRTWEHDWNINFWLIVTTYFNRGDKGGRVYLGYRNNEIVNVNDVDMVDIRKNSFYRESNKAEITVKFSNQ